MRAVLQIGYMEGKDFYKEKLANQNDYRHGNYVSLE